MNLLAGKGKKISVRRLTGAGLVLLLAFFTLFTQPAKADNENYGEDAYAYLQYIDQNLGYRVSDVSITRDTTSRDLAGAWIESELHKIGYRNVNRCEIDLAGNHAISYYVRKPGASQNRLVIGAHYDCVETNGVEDNGTGISVCLELAKRFLNTDTPLTIDFCFFDGEETIGFAGSYSYLEQIGAGGIVCYLNLDCLGAGDIMYVYGGDYEGDTLVRDWGYNMARTISDELGTPLSALPAAVGDPRTPTRPNSSDHYYFNQKGIPYIYLEANRWVREDGTRALEEKPHFYNSALSAFSSTNGQIIHTTQFEDLATLESLVPGRMKSHMTAFSHIASELIRRMDENSAGQYTSYTERPPETTPEVTETEETSTEESSLAESSTEESSTETETPEETTKNESTSASSESSTEKAETKEAETESTESAVRRPGIHLDRVSILYLGLSSLAIIGLVLVIIFTLKRRD